MHSITDRLPESYLRRVYEFAAILLQEGFVRDISNDKPHTLKRKTIKTYQHQINYLDHHLGSGAAHFEKFRQANVLVIGSGPLLLSILSSLLQSGVQTVHLSVTNKTNTSMEHIQKLGAEAQKLDADINIQDITPSDIQPWSTIIQPYDSILFAGDKTNIEQIIQLSALCERENKHFLPAVTYQNIGLAGPAKNWESAWRRLEKNIENNIDKTKEETNYTALAILANVLTFHWFQLIHNLSSCKKNHTYLLDMQTLEGKWHSFLIHPLTRDPEHIATLLDPSLWFIDPTRQQTDILHIFAQITSETTGIFRSWNPADLLQLPLSQCQVEITDPLENRDIPPIVSSGLTHLEARREAGLAGLEAYATLWVEGTKTFSITEGKIGAGQNITEAIYRGFIKCMEPNQNEPTNAQIVKTVEDQSRYLVDCLHTLDATPSLYLEQNSYGFPIAWVQVHDTWFHSAGLSSATALHTSLQKALHFLQNKTVISQHRLRSNCCNNLSLDSIKSSLPIIIEQLKKHNKQMKVYQLQLEKILSPLSIVYVAIKEEKK
jgi:putative thiazole-containing bacteriocin maturation protein